VEVCGVYFVAIKGGDREIWIDICDGMSGGRYDKISLP